MTRSRRQLDLFDHDLATLRTVVYSARLHKGRIAARKFKFTKGLEASVDILTKVMDALMDGDTAKLTALGVDVKAAQALGRRWQCRPSK